MKNEFRIKVKPTSNPVSQIYKVFVHPLNTVKAKPKVYNFLLSIGHDLNLTLYRK